MNRSLLTTLSSLIFLLALSSAKPSPNQAWVNKVDPWVLQTAQEGETEFLVYLNEQADLKGAAALPTKAEKGAYVFQKLTEVARRTQPALLAALERLGVEYRPFWVANMVWVRGDQASIQTLALRADIAHLYANPRVRMELPDRRPEGPDRTESATALGWNLQTIRVEWVWSFGYTGQGVVVGGQDTGYDWDHPALIRQYRGWDGATADHNYNWHDAIHDEGGSPCPNDSPEPCDDISNSHGTHTMGIMVGDDGGTHRIGVAPGARWIGCRNMDDGVGTPDTYAECYQWFVAPTDLTGSNPNTDLAPDVISNSWSCPPSEGCTDPDELRSVVEAVRAAGILTVHSAGNDGPNCSTVYAPAAIYEASFSVGATGSNDAIASFSSHGPVTVDGSNRLKPDVTAPGVNIISSIKGGGYSSLSGTSMAAPHVAGLAALLISMDPSLRGQVDELEALIEASAQPHLASDECDSVPGSIPNNTFGWGRVDALRAAARLMKPFFLPVVIR